ncbi:putative cytochrome p450 monooxygenase 2 protein [Neofusicoccum parvum UCRNP2]|uniref:Putative cytochrome p450 monooxygenase 2 protein n=1 Tax=Botryosphaeria parva (strain UCR-NP2) TaxID=1287680 RepID=R1E9N8_BOTPV|nr:putative cytochrome p450 monooxygenase 2 protein [Neofusicoccum parvum UCRNP2]
MSRIYYMPSVEDGSSIPGPAYTFLDGQMKDKFLNARNMSVEWQQKYGSIYRVWVGPNPEVIITDPKDVQTLYTHAPDHNKAHDANTGWLFKQVLGAGAGLINGKRWSNLRKTLDPMFSHKQAVQLVDTFNTSAEVYARGMVDFRLPEEKADDGRFVVNAAQSLMRYPYFEVAKIFYSGLDRHEMYRLWELGETFGQIFLNIMDGGINRSPLTKWLNTAAWRRTKAYLEQWEDFNAAAYRRRVAAGVEDPLVSLLRQAEAGEIDRQEVLHTLAESLFANLDVTTHVITSCVILLADAPQVQAELRKEFAEHAYDVDGYLSKRDTLLHYCLLESLRLQPVLAFSLPDKPPREKILGGYRIPKDTTILVDSTAINVRNPFWGPDRTEYRPSRFASIPPQQRRYNLATFGYGQRKCLGYHVGDKMVHALVYQLFSQYDVSVRPNMKRDDYFKTDRSNWVGLFDVELEMKKRE